MQTAQALIDLQCQLDEIEALRATYPEEEGCLQLAPAEQSALHAAHAAVAAGSAELLASLPNLSARVRLPGITLCGGSVAIHFQLPAAYPSSAPPSVRLELDAAPRGVHERLCQTLDVAMQDAAAACECSLLLLLDVLRDAACREDEAAAAATAAAAAAAAAVTTTAGTQQAAPAACPHELLRLVLWFHHIKSVTKRKAICGWARELGLGGLAKPGFPGVVVVEGLTECVRDFVARVRGLQWQAMQQRGEEAVPCNACATGRMEPLPARGFVGEFEELPETGLSELGAACRRAGCEHLFLAALKLAK